ncbi:glycosyltransferase family 1 protein [bacterium]|nr:glycosyltransferase family 1 protein [bacterium]
MSKTAYLAVRYLQQTGREVLIFAPDSAMPCVGDSAVVTLPSISVPGADESRAALPVGLLSRRLAAFNPDLILMFSPAFMAISGMVVGRERNIPVIACYQTDLPGYAASYGYPFLSYPIQRWLRYLHNGFRAAYGFTGNPLNLMGPFVAMDLQKTGHPMLPSGPSPVMSFFPGGIQNDQPGNSPLSFAPHPLDHLLGILHAGVQVEDDEVIDCLKTVRAALSSQGSIVSIRKPGPHW